MKRRRGANQKSDIDTGPKQVESDIPEPPYEIANRDCVPVITSKTTPGHALSDMDRDVKLSTTYFVGLTDIEVGIR
ncbi:hypothetical protein N7478_008653 [Penicillium angulare]|uniref:uncharacterized protein n=1 Tax=Penicillium angulare TaxID=116970 RepID=UPI002540DD06|nr:uncharacterized protein N7478_008653 [Penicillium angulare]KAJ5273528.1 hypothetical protein N7478_008653 [Penicillium angulare]